MTRDEFGDEAEPNDVENDVKPSWNDPLLNELQKKISK